ncbi:seipin isoform X2 [Taeniopygia guttata]
MAPGGLPPPPLLLWGAQLGRGARRALLRGALGLSLALLLLWAALFLYGSFYWAYLPAAALLRPLHLAFRSDCDSPGPELCSFPSANVSLLGEHREKVLLYGQVYRISLELELPESPVNRELGMFMVTLTCYGHGGRTLATAARSAMLHYRSRLLRALHTVAFSGLFLSGFAEQSQTLELELMARYREDPYTPTVGALVEIRSRRVQLYGARLRVHAHFSGLRYLLYHFPLTSAVLGVAGNWALLALLTLGGYLQWGRGQRPPRPAQERPSHGGAPGEGEGTDLSASPQNPEEPESVGASEPNRVSRLLLCRPRPAALCPAPAAVPHVTRARGRRDGGGRRGRARAGPGGAAGDGIRGPARAALRGRAGARAAPPGAGAGQAAGMAARRGAAPRGRGAAPGARRGVGGAAEGAGEDRAGQGGAGTEVRPDPPGAPKSHPGAAPGAAGAAGARALPDPAADARRPRAHAEFPGAGAAGGRAAFRGAAGGPGGLGGLRGRLRGSPRALQPPHGLSPAPLHGGRHGETPAGAGPGSLRRRHRGQKGGELRGVTPQSPQNPPRKTQINWKKLKKKKKLKPKKTQINQTNPQTNPKKAKKPQINPKIPQKTPNEVEKNSKKTTKKTPPNKYKKLQNKSQKTQTQINP